MKCVGMGALVLCSSLLWAGPGPKNSGTLVITNVNVVDTRSGAIQRNVNVIVVDGIIRDVSKVALVESGKQNRVVNASGKYLIPGLWNMHARTSAYNVSNDCSRLSIYLLDGITGLRDLDGEGEKGNATDSCPWVPEIEDAKPTLHPEILLINFEAIDGISEESVADRPGTWLHRELRRLVTGGSTPFKALQAATFSAARYLSKLDQFGVIERGHIADMVLLEGNPIDDIGSLDKIAAVVLRGQFLSRQELDAIPFHDKPSGLKTAKTQDPDPHR